MRCDSNILFLIIGVCVFSLLFTANAAWADERDPATGTYNDLINLFMELRVLEQPVTSKGVPDYSSETTPKIRRRLTEYQTRLAAIDTSRWLLEQKIDYELVRAEMNGLDFNLRILQPWARDPAYYALVWSEQSDTPSHEGPVCHAAIELWTYNFPLSPDDEKKLAAQLKIIPPFLEQARTNLTGNARDLWIAGIKSIRDQIADLDDLTKKTIKAGREFQDALGKARSATLRFAEWLEQQATLKTGPSGIGKDNYTWYLRHVLLVPLTWDEEVALLSRELARAYSSLQLERQHNRNLPQLKAISSPQEFNRHADQSIRNLMKFLKEREILPVKDYMEPALRKHIGSFQPEEKRNFFHLIIHYEPAVLYTHATHWFDLARMAEEPHPSLIRRDPLPYNIWLSRSEGLATGVEEMFMHTGLYDDNPRVRELVWIMLAQRCARGLASLYAHANEITLEQAGEYQITWTAAGWTGDVGLVAGEQHLYLRQPGYGPGYVTGKYLLERLAMDRGRQLEDNFRLNNFFGEMYDAGMIPVSLIRWQLTGMDDEIKSMHETN
ncbi:DUF885 domain-containing protein [bacterium]|nr:MAG: DUF885 domain-containing protein [bacterium]